MEKQVQLSASDRERINNLHADASSRLLEAASIAAKALGYKAEVTELEFEKKGGSSAPHTRLYHVQPVGHRVYFVTDGGCGYYDYDSGECVATPCH